MRVRVSEERERERERESRSDLGINNLVAFNSKTPIRIADAISGKREMRKDRGWGKAKRGGHQSSDMALVKLCFAV